MKIVLFVNDSYFSYLLAKPIFEFFYRDIQLVVFSSRIKGSAIRITDIYKKTHWRYFFYRVLVDIISRINALRGNKTVISLVRKYNLKFLTTSDVNSISAFDEILPIDIGIAFNFDQIIKRKLLNFKYGVLNVHASKLPNDKGISPVLWAFARRDASVWSTIYRMDEGIDTGYIYKQIKFDVKKEDTAFSLYERVCYASGKELAFVLESFKKGKIETISYSSQKEGNYLGWLDKKHKAMMQKSGRRFITVKDIVKMLKK